MNGTPISKDYHGSIESDPNGYVVYHSEGQVRQVDNALHWEYALRDHLGNTRILYEENSNSLDILQNNQYYAFGMAMYGEWSKQGMSKNDYKYNGKEMNMKKNISADEKKQRTDNSTLLLGTGAGLGAYATATTMFAGVTCPLCIVAIPVLLATGVYQKMKKRRKGNQKSNIRATVQD